MNLLMITRKVDRQDSNAGFIFWFIEEIARQLKDKDEKAELYVICLDKGDLSGLGENIEVYSMGKERRVGKLGRLIRGEWLIMKLIGKVDGVFTHMMPEYASLAGVWCKIFRKKLAHWYMHKAVNKNLKRAERWVDEFVTASALSFRMKTKKPVHYAGHIIDTDKFKEIRNEKLEMRDNTIRILSVSRISPSKDIETLVEAVEVLQENKKTRKQENKNNIAGAPLVDAQEDGNYHKIDGLDWEVEVIGGPGLEEQEEYFEDLKKMVKDRDLDGVVKFLGPIGYGDLPSYYQEADIFVNLSHTGSLDKTVLEAMASGCLPLTCNEAFNYLFKDKGLCFEKKNPRDLARKIVGLVKMSKEKKDKLRQALRREVVENHSLKKTVGKILKLFT